MVKSNSIRTRIFIGLYHLSELGPVLEHRAFLLIVARGDIGRGRVLNTPATGKWLR